MEIAPVSCNSSQIGALTVLTRVLLVQLIQAHCNIHPPSMENRDVSETLLKDGENPRII